MTLVQSWVDSLTLLKPKNLQLFAMVTIKSIIEAYTLYLRYFWWIFIGMVICYFLLIDPDTTARGVTLSVLVLSQFFYALLFLAACFVTRPSIMRKDWKYFTSKQAVLCIAYCSLLIFVVGSGLSPWSIFLVLFFIDSDLRPKSFFLSMWNALKMVIYNYPLIVIMGICLYLPVLIFDNTFFINPLLRNIIAALLLPIGVCTYTNIYIKKLHDQFDLYFNKPQ